MISFNLRCANDHVFEAWFPHSEAYEKQARRGQVTCPRCGDTKTVKAPMAPNIASGKSREGKPLAPAELREAMAKLRVHVEANCDYVGREFPEEARRIHYGETETRGIYGEANLEEVRELQEEDIEVLPIPSERADN